MPYRLIVKILAYLVIGFSTLIIIGWLYKIPIFLSPGLKWPTIKFITACTFLLCGIILFFMVKLHEGWRSFSQFLLPLLAFYILLFMGTLFVTTTFKLHSGLEDLFVMETATPVLTILPGMPAFVTMVGFILFAAYTFYYSLDLKAFLYAKPFGLALALIGLIAIIGYALKRPPLYYSIPNFSSAMALYTAVLFLMLGIGLLLLTKGMQSK